MRAVAPTKGVYLTKNSERVFATLYLGDTQIASLSVGMTYPFRQYRIDRTKRGTDMFEFVVSGKGYIDYRGKTYAVTAGDTLHFRQGATYIQYADPDEPYEKIWLSVSGDLVRALLTNYRFTEEIDIVPANTHTVFLDMHQAVMGDEGIERISLLLHKLILQMYRHSAARPPQNTLAQKIRHYLDEHVMEEIRLEEVAARFFISKIQLIRVFKRAYNTTPYAYILNAKLQLAQNLLLTTDVPIKEIAAQLNFTDGHYFTNSFKRQVGIPPGEFRKRFVSAKEANK